MQAKTGWRLPRAYLIITVLAVAAALGARLALAYYLYGNADQQWWDMIARIMREGDSIYTEVPYGYTVIWAYVLLALSHVLQVLHVPFHFVVRSFLTLVDIANAVVIGLIAARLGVKSFRGGFLAYFLNPVAIMIVGFHGQFENFAALPLLLAIYVQLRGKSRSTIVWVWLLATLSLLIKHINVFGVWMLFVYVTPRTRQATVMMAVSIAIFLAAFLPYLHLPGAKEAIISNILRYKSHTNIYGLTSLLPYKVIAPFYLLLMVSMPFLAKYCLRLPLVRGMELSFVALLALVYGIGKQYFILPILFGSVFASGWYWVYTVAAALFTANRIQGLDHFMSYKLPGQWNQVWIPTMAWFLSYFLVWRVDFRAALSAMLKRPAKPE